MSSSVRVGLAVLAVVAAFGVAFAVAKLTDDSPGEASSTGVQPAGATTAAPRIAAPAVPGALPPIGRKPGGGASKPVTAPPPAAGTQTIPPSSPNPPIATPGTGGGGGSKPQPRPQQPTPDPTPPPVNDG